jgi:hypothetical protein
MKNTKKSLTAVVVTAIALFVSVNISASQPAPRLSALAIAKAKWAEDQKRFAEQDAKAADAKAAEDASKQQYLFEAAKAMQSRYDNK